MLSDKYTTYILARLKSAGETVYARGRHDHPCFKSAPQAAATLLALLPPGAIILVMRDACLRPLREMILRRGDTLVTTDKSGQLAVSIPPSALGNEPDAVLRLHPLPKGSELYTGQVDAVIVACLAFCIGQPRLYGFDTERTAGTIENLTEGSSKRFSISPNKPIICLASDAQQVSNWPSEALSYVSADVVITSTRAVDPSTNTEIKFEDEEA